MIRFATVEDVPVILKFIRALADYEQLAHEVVASEALLKETLFGETPHAEVLLVESDGEPAGFALFFHNYSTFLGRPGIYLEDLFVLPEHRGKGLGKALLVRLAQLARERHCGRLEWSVLDWNRPAIEFYETMGARPQKGWTVYRLAGESLSKVAELAAGD
jgi:GNAT superfamily N-acetyltransferase